MPASPAISPAISTPPRPTRAGRVLDFLAVLFPVPNVVAGVASFACAYLGLQAVAGIAPLRLTFRVLPGAAIVVLSMLLLRVYDELKDVETDLRLGRAGDPKYAARPIVTGHVTRGDIESLRNVIVAALFALNVTLASAWTAFGFSILFALLWLSSRWFFVPAISKDLRLAFLTHNPLALALFAYVATIFVADFGVGALNGFSVALVLGIFFPSSAWETSRKIRVPADETDYQTYSKMFGYRVAALLPALFVVLSAISMLSASYAAGLGASFVVFLVAAALVPVGAVARFLARPTTRSARLQPAVEIYLVALTLGFPAALVVRRGLGWE